MADFHSWPLDRMTGPSVRCQPRASPWPEVGTVMDPVWFEPQSKTATRMLPVALSSVRIRANWIPYLAAWSSCCCVRLSGDRVVEAFCSVPVVLQAIGPTFKSPESGSL